MHAAEISRTGLDVEWQRLQVIAQNLANMNSSATAGGQAYRAMRLVSGPKAGFGGLLAGVSPTALNGVAVLGLHPTGDQPRRVYEPGNPNADDQGFVTYSSVDQAAEMALLLKTSRAYEANISALSLASQMYARALELGKQS